MSTAAGTDRRTLLRTGVAGLAALAAGAVLTPSAQADGDRELPMSPLTLWLRGAPPSCGTDCSSPTSSATSAPSSGS
ncbi:hypothetical protein NQP46_15875 [Streptomyces albus]|nr:hypothetical protein NQP46_15875 [Streptomyces albus]